MAGSTSSAAEAEDRLSELPDSLIFEIFCFLPLVDVIRTTVLSTRWRNLWTTIPRLAFDGMEGDQDQNFINGALNLWRGSRLLEFSVHLCEPLEMSTVRDIHSWLRFATQNKVEELNLVLTSEYNEAVVWVPQCLFTCSSLKVLTLEGCFINLREDVQWNQLESLMIDCVWLNEHVVNHILCGCPQLEVFIFSILESKDSLSIRSTSLKRLVLEKYLRDGDIINESMDSVLRIWTPNLEKLEMSGAPYGKYLLMNVSSLTHVNLGFYGPTRYVDDLFPWNDALGERLPQILSSIKHVEKVTLSDWCIQVLGTMETKTMLSPFANVKRLELNGCFSEIEPVVHVLEMFPALKTLVLGALWEFTDDPLIIDESSQKFEGDLPNSFLPQLRRVEVSWSRGDTSLYVLVELLLKYAKKLDRVVFHKNVRGAVGTIFDVEVSTFNLRGTDDEKAQVLARMRR